MNIRFTIKMKALGLTKPGLMNTIEDAIVRAVRAHGGEIQPDGLIDANYSGEPYPTRLAKSAKTRRAKGGA